MNRKAFYSQKGGVGKTTSAVNVARILGEQGYRVLVIDCDPRGGATKLLGITDTTTNLSHVIGGAGAPTATLDEAAQVSRFDKVWCVPAQMDEVENAIAALTMRQLDPMTNRRMPADRVLASAIDRSALGFDYVLIDCLPTTDILAVAAIVAADEVIIPTPPEELPIEAAALTVEVVRLIAESVGRTIPARVLATMVQDNLVNHREGMAAITAAYGEVFAIPRRSGRDAVLRLLEAYQPFAYALNGGQS